MSSKHVLHAVDRCLRDIMNKDDIPFGGKLIVFGGDFRQTLTVVSGGNKAQIVEECFQSSYLWSDVDIMHLTINERVKRNITEANK